MTLAVLHSPEEWKARFGADERGFGRYDWEFRRRAFGAPGNFAARGRKSAKR